MGVLDRKHPEPLGAVVDHARRFCAFLEWIEARHPDPRRWLVGRRDEVRLVVRLRVRDWRADRIGLAYAARTIGAYLDEVHLGAAGSLGLPANVLLHCCSPEEAITLPLEGGCGPAAYVAPEDPRDARAAGTWIDLATLLDVGLSAQGVEQDASERDDDLRAPHDELPEPRANRV